VIFQAKMTLRAIGRSDPAVSHEQRRAIAQRFIELDDKLRDIDEHCRGLELAQKLRPECETGRGLSAVNPDSQ